MRRPRSAAAAAGLMAALAAVLPAQTLSVSLQAGGFLPAAGDYRQIYGAGAALAADAWFKLRGPIGFAAGFGSLSDEGLAIREGEGSEQALSFRRTSVPLIAFYEFGAPSLAVRLGAGAAFHSFRETWRTADLDHRGHAVSPRVLLAVSLRLGGRFSLFGSAAFDPIRAATDPALGRTVSIGGLQLLGGLAFRVFSR